MGSLIEQLQELGFTQYEAQAYITLLQHTPLNGYELAKHSNIPRANIYPVLQKLEDRGAVMRMETENTIRYTPVPVEQFINRLQQHYQETLDAAGRSLAEIYVRTDDDAIWNSRGYHVLIDLARSLIDTAREKLLVAVSPPEAATLAEVLLRAEERGVEITTLCQNECQQECGGCRGSIHRYPIAPVQQDRWLVLVRDEEELLAGEIHQEGETSSVRTRQKLLVSLAAWYIRQSVALSAMIQQPGGLSPQGLSPATRDLLGALDMGNARPAWAQQWRRFLETN